MKRIKFTLDTVFETFGAGHPENPHWAADEIADMRDDQAQRWLKRKRAELVEDLGPDEIPGADVAQVDEIKAEVERRFGASLGDALDDLDAATDLLKTALTQ